MGFNSAFRGLNQEYKLEVIGNKLLSKTYGLKRDNLGSVPDTNVRRIE